MREVRMRRVRWAETFAFIGSVLICLRDVRSYAPITEGWWLVYSRWIGEGRVPYRDFELLVPPGYPLLIRGLTSIVGEGFLELRIVGAIAMGAIGVCICALIREDSGSFLSPLIACSAVAYMTSMTAFIAYDYHQFAILGVLLTFVLIRRIANHATKNSRYAIWRWVLIGIVVGFTLSIKQTHGVLCLLGALTSAAVLNRKNSLQHRCRALATLLLGVVIFWSPILLWFWLRDVTPLQILVQSFQGASSKGNTHGILTGWIERQLTGPAPATYLSSLLYLTILLVLLDRITTFLDIPLRAVLYSRMLVGLLLLLTLFIQWSNLGSFGQLIASFWSQFLANRFFGSFILVVVLAGYDIVKSQDWNRISSRINLICCVSAIYFAGALSAAVDVNSAFISTAVALSFIVVLVRNRPLAEAIIGLAAVAIISGSYYVKANDVPYRWWGYQTPNTAQLDYEVATGLMSGLKMTTSLNATYSRIGTVLAAGERCDGEIITFPSIPFFQLDQGLTPRGRLAQYWYDFSSELEVQNEIDRISRAQVKSIVVLELPDVVLKAHEDDFNGGNPLAHRRLQETLLQRSLSMTEVVSSEVSPDADIKMWISPCVSDQLPDGS